MAGGEAQIASLFARIQVSTSDALTGLRAIRSNTLQTTNDLKTLRDQARMTLSGMNQSYKDLSKNLKETTPALEKALGSPFKGMLTSAKDAFLNVGALIAAPLALVDHKALEMVGNYEKNMAVFQLVTKASASDMEKAGTAIEGLSHDMSLPFDKSQISDALTTLARGGLTAADSVKALHPALLLASAGEATAQQGAELMAATLKMFHIPADQAIDVADKLTAAMKFGGLSFQDISEVMKIAGPVFASTGDSLDDMATLAAEFGQQGVKGSTGATALRDVISSLRAPSAEQIGLLKGIGVQLFDANNKSRPFRDILADLHTGFGKLTQAQQNQIGSKVFGENYGAMLQIIRGGVPAFDDMKSKIQEHGIAQQVATAKTDNLEGALKNLTKEFNNAAFAAFKDLAPSLKVVLGHIIDLFKWFQDLPAPVRSVLGWFALLMPVIVSVGLAIMGIGAFIGGLVTAFGSIGGAVAGVGSAGGILSAIFTGIGTAALAIVGTIGTAFAAIPLAVIAAVAAVVLVVLAFVNNWFGVRDKAASLISGGKELIGNFFAGIKQGWDNLSSGGFDPIGWIRKTIVQPIKDFFHISSPSGWMADEIGKPLGQGLLEGLTNFVPNIADGLNSISRAFKGLYEDIYKFIITDIGDVFNTFGKWVTGLVSGPVSTLSNAIGSVASSLGFKLPGRASGGDVSGGQAYMVGESGPELFVPGNSGIIVPNRSLAGAGGGGGGTTVQVIFQGPVYGMDDFNTKVRQAGETSFRRGGR